MGFVMLNKVIFHSLSYSFNTLLVAFVVRCVIPQKTNKPLTRN